MVVGFAQHPCVSSLSRLRSSASRIDLRLWLSKQGVARMMNRRSFLRMLGIGVVAAPVVAKAICAPKSCIVLNPPVIPILYKRCPVEYPTTAPFTHDMLMQFWERENRIARNQEWRLNPEWEKAPYVVDFEMSKETAKRVFKKYHI